MDVPIPPQDYENDDEDEDELFVRLDGDIHALPVGSIYLTNIRILATQRQIRNKHSTPVSRKKTLLISLLIAGTIAMAYAQDTTGNIQWGNNYAPNNFRSLIYGPDPGNVTLAQVGQSTSSMEIPTGTTVYGGPLLSGTGYTFAFFAGPAGSPSNALTLYAQTAFRTGANAGLVSGGTATIAGTVGGGQATFQIRVWDNQGGTLTTWAQAETAWENGLTDAAVSPLVLSGPLGGLDTNLNAHPPQVDSGWVSFNTYYIPEPASFTLGALGAAALLICRRRK